MNYSKLMVSTILCILVSTNRPSLASNIQPKYITVEQINHKKARHTLYRMIQEKPELFASDEIQADKKFYITILELHIEKLQKKMRENHKDATLAKLGLSGSVLAGLATYLCRNDQEKMDSIQFGIGSALLAILSTLTLKITHFYEEKLQNKIARNQKIIELINKPA